MKIIPELFDVVAWLQESGVEHVVGPAPDVSPGWVGIRCPFCDDPLFHLGIEVGTGRCNCFRCGGKGLASVVQEVERVSYGRAIEIVERFYLRELTPEERDRIERRLPEDPRGPFVWPQPGTEPILEGTRGQDLVLDYLMERGFNPKKICQHWDPYWGGRLGPWKYRLVIPIRMDGKVVACVGRDVTGKAMNPYRNSSNELSTVPPKHCLYNIDSVREGDPVIVVEGIFDVWKLGAGAVATLGVLWTQEQVALLRGKGPERVIILYDDEPEAQRRADLLAREVWFCDAEVVRLHEAKDPGELTLAEGAKLMGILTGR